jgi:hypothetical protein
MLGSVSAVDVVASIPVAGPEVHPMSSQGCCPPQGLDPIKVDLSAFLKAKRSGTRGISEQEQFPASVLRTCCCYFTKLPRALAGLQPTLSSLLAVIGLALCHCD